MRPPVQPLPLLQTCAVCALQFSPPVLEEVTQEMVDAYLRPFQDPALELQLPARRHRFASQTCDVMLPRNSRAETKKASQKSRHHCSERLCSSVHAFLAPVLSFAY